MDLATKVIRRRKELNMSQDELAEKMGYKSRSSINKIEKGRPISQKIIKRLANALDVSETYLMGFEDEQQSVALPTGAFIPKMQRVPILGEIACGKPIFSPDEFGEMAELPEGTKADFALIASGDSMTGARIYSGDTVFCRTTSVVDNGTIAAVAVDDELTLKRFYFYPDKDLVILKPENPAYSDMLFVGPEIGQIRVLGQAVAFQSKIR